MDREEIIEEMADRSSSFDLEGVEFTEEDANAVLDKVNNGMDIDDAIDETLQGIRDVLADGWEF